MVTKQQIEAATSLDELANLRALFEADYKAGVITYAQYIILYTAYLRRSYYLDLYLRGGTWELAAEDFWAKTADITDYTKLYSIYLQYFDGGEVPELPPPSTSSNLLKYALLGGLLIIGVVLTQKKKQVK